MLPNALVGRSTGRATSRTSPAGVGHRARLMERHARPPSYDDVELVVEILASRNFGSRDLNAESDERAAQADRLTDEQAMILNVTRLLNRVEIRGDRDPARPSWR